jgi:hypothetical protein
MISIVLRNPGGVRRDRLEERIQQLQFEQIQRSGLPARGEVELAILCRVQGGSCPLRELKPERQRHGVVALVRGLLAVRRFCQVTVVWEKRLEAHLREPWRGRFAGLPTGRSAGVPREERQTAHGGRPLRIRTGD